MSKEMKYVYNLDLSAEDGYFRDYMEAKGYFPNAIVTFEGKKYSLNIYDNIRLTQDIESEFTNGGDVFFEQNILVVKNMSIETIRNAIEEIIKMNGFSGFVIANSDVEKND